MNELRRYRAEITIETASITKIRTGGNSLSAAYCGRCGQKMPPSDYSEKNVDVGGAVTIANQSEDGETNLLTHGENNYERGDLL